MAIHEPLYRRHALLSVNTNPKDIAVFIFHFCEDHGRDVEVAEDGIDEVDLFFYCPYDV